MEQTADFFEPNNTETDKKAKKYNQVKRRLSISNYIIDFLFLLLFLLTGMSLSLQRLFEEFTSNPWFVVGGYFFIFIILIEILSLPISFYSSFYIEHYYKLSNQSLNDWLKDKIKGFAISIVLGLSFLELLYWILRSFPSWWWLIGAFTFTIIFVLLAKLFPVLFIPIFFKFKPIEDEELKKRLLDMASKAGTTVRGIYKIDLSKKSKTANAGLVGLGNTRRIVLSDTLLNKFHFDEIEVILAHELGHHLYKHMSKLIIIQSMLTISAFFVADKVLKRSFSYFNFEFIHDIGNLPIFLLVFLILGFVFFPFANSYSRKLEKAADRYALLATRNKNAFISSMKKLASLNLAEIEPSAFIELIFYSHPSIQKRIEFAKSYVWEGGNNSNGRSH